MASNKFHVVVVCGYGCDIDSPLRTYLDRVWKFLVQWQPEAVIFTGGYTQGKSFPGRSEAQVMYDYVYTIMPKWEHQKFLDKTSYTTYDNIRHAAEAIKWELDGPSKYTITIFCESQRALKVSLLSRHFMRGLVNDIDDIRIETCNWERTNPDRQLWTAIRTRLEIRFPFLARLQSERRRRLSMNR